MLKEFREFIKRGNVLDLAVAVIIGAAFGKIVTTLVEGVIMPPVGLLLGKTDFASLFYVLDASKGVPASLADAFVVFLVVKAYNRLKSKQATDAAPTTKDCPHCLSTIPLKATRCKDCTAELQAV